MRRRHTNSEQLGVQLAANAPDLIFEPGSKSSAGFFAGGPREMVS